MRNRKGDGGEDAGFYGDDGKEKVRLRHKSFIRSLKVRSLLCTWPHSTKNRLSTGPSLR
jgi:hypothetical protein